jgi:hypothetical protein
MELVVASITESRGPKSDARDAFGLADALRLGAIATPVFKPPTRFELQREPDHGGEKKLEPPSARGPNLSTRQLQTPRRYKRR